jgi:hypothetical protein
MQTLTQTFAAGGLTWEHNAPGKYFTILAATSPVDIAMFKGGKKLDFGDIKGVLSGIEIGGNQEGVDFDRVQVTTTAAGTVTIGIGNGQVRYNRGAASVDVLSQEPVRTGAVTQAAATVTTASAVLVAAKSNRKYLLVQNKSLTGNIWLVFGAAATQALGIKVVPGGFYELNQAIPTQEIRAVGDIASNPDVVVVEG